MSQQSREIRNRIKSVSNTQKITRTMEMVATSKLKRAQGRVVSSGPYFEGLRKLMGDLAGKDLDLSRYPLFAQREVKRVLILLVTANRGLCGGFNSNLVRAAMHAIRDERAAGHEVILHVAGRKGIAAMKFAGYEMEKTYTDFPDRPEDSDAERLLPSLVEPFLKGEIDQVKVVYAHFISIGQQPPTVRTICPVGAPSGVEGDEAEAEAETSSSGAGILFEPSQQDILDELLPLYVRNMIYRVLIESVASEQVARRIAMKRASDNAEDMVKDLRRKYNSARQAQITQELAEILGGSEALK